MAHCGTLKISPQFFYFYIYLLACLFIHLFLGSHYEAQAVLELTIYSRLASNSETASLCLPNAGNGGVCHRMGAHFFPFQDGFQLDCDTLPLWVTQVAMTKGHTISPGTSTNSMVIKKQTLILSSSESRHLLLPNSNDRNTIWLLGLGHERRSWVTFGEWQTPCHKNTHAALQRRSLVKNMGLQLRSAMSPASHVRTSNDEGPSPNTEATSRQRHWARATKWRSPKLLAQKTRRY